jgi:ATP-dependent DNA ligase
MFRAIEASGAKPRLRLVLPAGGVRHRRLQRARGVKGAHRRLLLGYYDDAQKLIYVGHVGAGMSDAELRRLRGAPQPLRIRKCRSTSHRRARAAFGSPLNLARVHGVRPELASLRG